MPVGTRGAVKLLTSTDLEALGTEVMLTNTYHLMLRPGVEVISKIGGIHKFMAFDNLVITDSGGYQIFSLKSKIDNDGAIFKSVYDGSTHRLTPEQAVEAQVLIGADIQMVLDVCPAPNGEPEALRTAVELTSDWAQRARQTFLAHKSASLRQSQFGIVQGGVDEKLRIESAQRIVDVGFDGYAIGGLSIGENRRQMIGALQACVEELPDEQPRYFMGLGDPIGIVECVALGVDMFDCVLPTRLARHGTVLTDEGKYNLRRVANANSDEPLDPTWPDSPARLWSRGYLRHLMQTNEPTSARILTMHNVGWVLRFMRQVADSIKNQNFEAFRQRVHSTWAR